MTLIFERDLYMVKMNRCTKYLGQMSFCLNVIFRGTHTHTPDLCFHWTIKVLSRLMSVFTELSWPLRDFTRFMW